MKTHVPLQSKSGILKTTVTLISLAILFLSSSVFAHGNNITHPGLTNEAISVADIPEITAKGSFDISTDAQCSFIDEGSVKEDLGFGVSDSWDTDVWGNNSCSLAGLNWQYHSYNPVTGDCWMDWATEDTITYVIPIWAAAFPNNYFELGRVAHLLEDMTSPAHVHIDIHASGDDFETWGENHFDEYDFSGTTPYIPYETVTLPDNTQVPGHSIEGFIHSLAQFTYELSSFEGHIQEVESELPDSELKRMFPSLHYNDGGILNDGYWEIDNIGRYEDFSFDPEADDWWPCENDSTEDNGGTGGARRIMGNFYIENTAGDNGVLTPEVFEKTGIYETSSNTLTLCQIYGDVLFPKTVSYVAGLYYVFTGTVPNTPQLSSPASDAFAQGENIQLTWEQSPTAHNYHLQIALDPGFSNLFYDLDAGSNNSIELGGFPDNGTTKFYWRVKAENPGGWSNYSDYWALTSGCMNGDFDSDCDVDIDDLSIFAFHWLDTGCSGFDLCGGTDMTRNGNVNLEDFAAFEKQWLKTTPEPSGQNR